MKTLKRGKRSGRKRGPAATMEDVRAHLMGLGRETLVSMLMRLASGDGPLARGLLLEAARSAGKGPNIDRLRNDLEYAIRSDDFVPWAAVHEYVNQVDKVVDDVERLLEDGYAAAAIDLTEDAIVLLEKQYERVDDSSGSVGSEVDRLVGLHISAWSKAGRDMEEMGEKLAEWEGRNQYGLFFEADRVHAKALGRKGRDAFRRFSKFARRTAGTA